MNWIPVEQELPEEGQYVWVYDSKAVFDSKQQRTVRYSKSDRAWDGAITHWQPLPKPPDTALQDIENYNNRR